MYIVFVVISIFFIVAISCVLYLLKKYKININSLMENNKLAVEEIAELKLKVLVNNEKLIYADNIKNELSEYKVLLDHEKSLNSNLLAQVASLEVENKKNNEHYQSRITEINHINQQMKDAFSVISKDALLKNTDMLKHAFNQSLEHFMKTSAQDRSISQELLANIMQPLKESLTQVNHKVHELETKRQGAYEGLKEQIDGLLRSQLLLQKETQNLSRALYTPAIKGRWGEMQLRRVVELSGLSPHCDFIEQKNITESESVRRPDMIVTLPKNKKIIIDAKAPIEFIDNNCREDDGNERDKDQQLVSTLKRHILSLKKKSYNSIINDTPEFIVMFLPGEALLHRALNADPLLLDFAAQNEILITTPVTLVALLKAVAFNFNQEAIANNIEEVRYLSKQLLDRVEKMTDHFAKLGRSLKQAAQCYNQTLSSLDSRVLVTARKLASIKSVNKDEDMMIAKLPLIEEVITNPDIKGDN